MPKRMTENQLANLTKGRVKGIKRKSTTTPQGTTWKELIATYGDTEASPELARAAGFTDTVTWKQLVVASWYRQAAMGNAAISRELMQRTEPLTADVPTVTVNNVIRVRDMVSEQD